MKEKKAEENPTLAGEITRANDNSDKGRWGLLTGNRRISKIGELYRKIGKSALLSEAAELEQRGLLKVDWIDGKSAVGKKGIVYSQEHMDEFYRLTGQEHPKYQLLRQQKEMTGMLEEALGRCRKPWIRGFLEENLSKVRNAAGKKLPKEITRELILCFQELDRLKEPVYKRVFSVSCLKDSKAFENHYEKQIIAAARGVCDAFPDTMEDSGILEEIGIMEYSAELYLKGPVRLTLCGQELFTEKFRYGTVLNVRTMREAGFLPGQKLKRILTIENKANFEAARYREDTLYVYTHGFPGPEERRFLIRLREHLEKEAPGQTEYLHSSDLDYGGICIFRYIRERIFPEVRPYRMDPECYMYYLQKGYGYDISEETLKKLAGIQEPLLAELAEKILKEKKGIEQECFLISMRDEGGMADAGKDRSYKENG